MKFVFLFNLFCYLLCVFAALKNPFSIEHQGIIFRSNYSEANKLTIISFDKSNFSIKIGSRVISKSEGFHGDDTLKVNIYPHLFNPSLKKEPQKLTKIGVLCEFSYPLTVVSSDDSYQCSLTYRDRSGNHHTIGSCKLPINYKSTICFLEGMLETGLLSEIHQVVVSATIFHCNKVCVRDSDLNWKSVVKSSATVTLVSWNDIIWMRTTANMFPDIRILMGVPRNPINKSTTIEIPFKLRKSESNIHIASVNLQVIHDKLSVVEDVVAVGCFIVADSKTFEDGPYMVTEIEVNLGDSVPRTTCDPELLFVVQMSVKEDSRSLGIQISLEKIVFRNGTTKDNQQSEKINNTTFINLTLYSGRYSIIPVIQNPIILPNLEKLYNPYELKPEDLKIFYNYIDTGKTDVSSKILCRPFDSVRLRCPPNMQKLTPVFTAIDNPDSMKWSLELMIEDTLMVVTIKPLIRTEIDWIVSYSDSVLNQIFGWEGIKRSEDRSLATLAKCEPLYQVVAMQIYKRIVVYNEETNHSFVTVLDMSGEVNVDNVRLSKDTAHVYRRENSLVIQGINRGNLDVDLVTKDNITIHKSQLFVHTGTVSVSDLEVTCISNISISKETVFSSSLILISNLYFRFKTLSRSRSCLLIVDLIFSDGSRTNVFSFPQDQYTLKFITNTNIIEISGLDSMWYDFQRFNGAESFQVELQESKFCNNPRTVFVKNVSLNLLGIERHSSTSTRVMTTRSTTVAKSKNYSSKLSKESSMVPQVNTKFIYVAIIAAVLAVLIICSVLGYCMKMKPFAHNSSRSKSRNGCNNNGKSDPGNNYPPLLPPPGPQVELSDAAAVTISSPHSFWCNDQRKMKSPTKDGNFIRQNSLPIKASSTREPNDAASWLPLKWMKEMMPSSSITNSYTSHDGLNSIVTQEMFPCSPMTWSTTQKDVDDSSGVGSLNTNVEDTIKDPYGSRERFHKLSELAYSNSNNQDHVYDMV